jgi:hypothetical protein
LVAVWKNNTHRFKEKTIFWNILRHPGAPQGTIWESPPQDIRTDIVLIFPVVNPLAPNFFLILAHAVCKMWIVQVPKKVAYIYIYIYVVRRLRVKQRDKRLKEYQCRCVTSLVARTPAVRFCYYCAVFRLEPLAQDPRDSEITDMSYVNLFTPLPLPCSALTEAWNFFVVITVVSSSEEFPLQGLVAKFSFGVYLGEAKGSVLAPCVTFVCFWSFHVLLRDRDIFFVVPRNHP